MIYQIQKKKIKFENYSEWAGIISNKILYMQSHTDVDTNELIITRAKRDLAAATLPSTYYTQSAEFR